MRGAATDSYLPSAADHRVDKGRLDMILATTKVEEYERFLAIFSTKGAEKRGQHGSKGATVFRDPHEADRVWLLFNWDLDGWQSFDAATFNVHDVHLQRLD